MKFIEYNLGLTYAIETYIRRDVAFVMSQIHGNKNKKGLDDKKLNLHIPQPGIEQWVKDNMKKVKEGTVINVK